MVRRRRAYAKHRGSRQPSAIEIGAGQGAVQRSDRIFAAALFSCRPCPRPQRSGPSLLGVALLSASCIARDRRGYFRFVPIQMAEGRPLADQLGIDPYRPDSFAFVANGQGYVKSEAVLRIARELPRWRWTWVFHLIHG
jgi:DCC1-like thiol-disulfide oxidoreductase